MTGSQNDWAAAVQQLMTSVLSSGRGSIDALGAFEVFAKRSRLGRDPQTGAAVTIPPLNVLRFKAAPDAEKALPLQTTGERVLSLEGLGTFEVRRYEAYEGRDPDSGERVLVPATDVVIFTPATALRERIASAPAVERESTDD